MLLGLIGLLCAIFPATVRAEVATPAATIINANITTATRWALAGSPYQVTSNISVVAGVTLTIDPGVEVRFNDAVELQVQGQLVAVGTAEQPILFTSVSGQPGAWYGISVNGTSSTPLTGTVFEHVVIEHSGRSIYGNLNLTHATVEVRHSIVRNSAATGIRGLAQGVAHISDSTISGNAGAAIEFGDGSVNPLLANLTITGNDSDAIVFGSGTLASDRTWRAVGVPYIFSNVTVAAGATLTVEPGVEARFRDSSELQVQGQLVAVGTAEQPILFTSVSGQPGAWYGISVNGTSSTPLTGTVFEHVVIEHSGRSIYGNLNLTHATVEIRHSIVRNSAATGIRGLAQGVAHISDSTISGNAGAAIEFSDGSVNPLLANLTITGNGSDAIVFGSGTLASDRTWRAVGVPYIFSNVTVAAGATLTVEPGVEARFRDSAELQVQGRLVAVGTTDQPILFTSVSGQPGAWYGISFNGTSTLLAFGEFDHVTVEHSGRSTYANLSAYRSQVVIKHSVIHQSAGDGIKAGGNAVVTVEASQIVENAGYGISNTSRGDRDVVIAANNWWGSPTGPIADNDCNPGGTGSRVSEGVAVHPYLTSVDQEPGPLAPTDARILTITPQRWFAPADNLARIYVRITLQDGRGIPLPGRTINLLTSLGRAVAGGVTDVQGQTLAYLTSSEPGDAELVASLERAACESARSPAVRVTFTTANPADLLPNAEAPYFSSSISITPQPIIRGVPTRLSARLTNPNNFPITVDATFGFVQAGIGLVFGPAGEVTGHVIPANSEGEIAVIWTPLVDGHYCVELTYTARRADATGRAANAPVQAGRSQRNLNVFPGPMGPPNEKDSLKKADDAIRVIGKVPSGPTQIHKGIISRWWGWMKKTASDISKNLGGDPPRQDYKVFALPEQLTLEPVQADDEISPARAAAINAVTAAFAEVNAYGLAATVSLDRYGGAAAARDLQWTSLQAGALLYYKQELGQALLLAAQRLDELRQVVADEGVTSIPLTADEVRAYQERLRTTGFTAEEISDGVAAGLSAAEIEALRQEILAADPNEEAGDLLDYLAEIAGAYRGLGHVLTRPPNFSALGGGGGVLAADDAPASDNLVRVYSIAETIQVGNPLAETATIELRVRPIDLPADWMVTVEPLSVSLAPGEQITATVRIAPVSPAVQGAIPRVAVEGYANDELLGGVAIDVISPQYAPFDGQLHSYLPLIQGD